jgi:hypothetical protein
MKKQLAVAAMMTAMSWAASSQAQPPAGDKPMGDKMAGDKMEHAAAGQAPKPAPENDVIKKSVGTWKCTAMGKGPDGTEMKYTTSWNVKPTMGGHWYAISYKRSKMGPMPAFEGSATVGYDTAQKKYTMIGFDSFGGWINLSSPDGANYSGQSGGMGKVGQAKFAFSPGKDKKGEDSDKLFDVTMDFGGPTMTENCKK